MKKLVVGLAMLVAACASAPGTQTPRPVPAAFAIEGVCDEWCRVQYIAALEAWEAETQQTSETPQLLAIASIAILREKYPSLGELTPEKRILALTLCASALQRIDSLPPESALWCEALVAPSPAPEEAPEPVESPTAAAE